MVYPPPIKSIRPNNSIIINSTKVQIVQQMIEERIPNLMKFEFSTREFDGSQQPNLDIFKRFFF